MGWLVFVSILFRAINFGLFRLKEEDHVTFRRHSIVWNWELEKKNLNLVCSETEMYPYSQCDQIGQFLQGHSDNFISTVAQFFGDFEMQESKH